MRIGTHLGVTFEIWTGRHTWFWLVHDRCRDGASVGAAANYVDAINEACSSIAEMVGRKSDVAITPRMSNDGASADQGCNSANSTLAWKELLTSIEHFLGPARSAGIQKTRAPACAAGC
jgi:hypothetical protein